MNYRTKKTFLCIMMILCLSGCTQSQEATTKKTTSATKETTSKKSSLDVFKENDYYSDYQTEETTTIALSSQTTDVKITSAGCYVLEGSLQKHSIIVDAKENDVVRIVLQNASIQSASTAPIYVKKAKKVILSLPQGTKNSITDTDSYEVNTDKEPTAAIFSKADLTINGSGELQVNASYKNGIQSKDKLKLLDANLQISAANDAVKGKDALYICDGTYTIKANKDGFVTTNQEKGAMILEKGTFHITAKQDGIQAATTLRILNGTYTIVSGEGSVNEVAQNQQPWGDFKDHEETDEKSSKGMKSGKAMLIENGSFSINAHDDAIHSNTTIQIKKGTFTLKSDDDGIHADQKLTIEDGTLQVKQSYEGLEALHIVIKGGKISVCASDDGINAAGEGNPVLEIFGGYTYVDAYGDGVDSNQDIVMEDGTLLIMGPDTGGNSALDYDGRFQMNGGTLIALGSSGMAMAPSSNSKQNSVMLNVDASLAAGKAIYLEDADRKFVIGAVPTRTIQSIVISSSDIKKNAVYQIMTNGTANKKRDIMATNATNGDKLTSLTIEETITTYGNSGMMGKPSGGMPPRGGRP